MPEKLDYLTPTAMKLLEVFLADPLIQLHEREVIRHTGVSKGSANAILRLLSKKSILVREDRGRMAFYRLNLDDPLTRQIKVLLNVQGLRGLVEKVKPHATRIIMFGSCAEGTDARESDVDLLVLSDEKGLVKRMTANSEGQFGRRIAPIIIDLNEYVQLKVDNEPLYETIERGVVLWETG